MIENPLIGNPKKNEQQLKLFWKTIEMVLGKKIKIFVVTSMVEIKWSSIGWLRKFGHQPKRFWAKIEKKIQVATKNL